MSKQLLDEFLIFSDLHAHNFKYGSRRVPFKNEGLYNSRLVDAVKVIGEIHAYALAQGVRRVLFGGDLFHRRSVLHTDALNLVYDAIAQLVKDVELVMIPGNHDYADKHGHVHALQAFKHLENCYVLDTVGGVTFDDTDVCFVCVPYTDNIEEAQQWLQDAGKIADSHDNAVLLAHLGMQGAVVGSDYVLVSDSDIRVSDVPQDSFAACFFGHYHEHQKLFKNGWFIGAATEQNWSDIGGKRGFLHVKLWDDNSVTFERIETQAPRFIDASDRGINHDIRLQDFVRCYVPKASHETKRRLNAEIDCASLEVLEMVDKAEIVLTLSPTQLDPANALEAWLKANPPGDMNSGDVLKYGLNVLREAVGASL